MEQSFCTEALQAQYKTYGLLVAMTKSYYRDKGLHKIITSFSAQKKKKIVFLKMGTKMKWFLTNQSTDRNEGLNADSL